MDSSLIMDENAKALRNFLTDIKCLDAIKDKANKFNLFDVFGFSRNEIRHSFVLKWLLDPTETHGLGDTFIKSLICYLVSVEPERYADNAFELLMMDCADFTVQREMKNIDLFLFSESKGVCVTIENKIGTHEHASTGFDSQLDKYKAYIEETYPDVKTKIYVFLTPQKELPSDEDTWQCLSYDELVKLIEEIYDDHKDTLSFDVKSLIRCYIEIIRRDIVENTELNELCNEIYKKHRKALDLIYAHSDMGMNSTVRVLTEVLKEKSIKNEIEYEPKDKVVFHTSSMNSFLPKLSECSSSWGTQYVYNYWFKIYDDNISFVFELGLQGVDEDTMKKMECFIKTRKPRNKKITNKYKRVETFKWVDLTDCDDEEKKTKINSIIDDVLHREKKWIDECEKELNANT